MKKKAKNKPSRSSRKIVVHKASPKNVSKTGIKPLSDRVLLRPIDSSEMGEKTLSGIIIPDTVSKEKPEQGEVVAVGEGKIVDGKLTPLSVKVGDKVIFSRYGYDEVK